MYKYHIIINNGKGNNHFQVPYGHTNGIEVAVSKNCAVITVHMKKIIMIVIWVLILKEW